MCYVASIDPNVAKKHGITAGAMYSLIDEFWPSYASKNGFFRVSIDYFTGTIAGIKESDVREAIKSMETSRDLVTMRYDDDIPTDKDFYVIPNYYGETENV